MRMVIAQPQNVRRLFWSGFLVLDIVLSARILTQAEMEAAFLPRNYRDRCAALLVPLNECRHANFSLPWKCGSERVVYQKCVADECVFRFKSRDL
jgi:hypothetical protein